MARQRRKRDNEMRLSQDSNYVRRRYYVVSGGTPSVSFPDIKILAGEGEGDHQLAAAATTVGGLEDALACGEPEDDGDEDAAAAAAAVKKLAASPLQIGHVRFVCKHKRSIT